MQTQLSTISRKGQVTVPKRIRDHLRLRPGDRVAFEREAEEVKIRKVSASSLYEFFRDNPIRGRGVRKLLRELRAEWD
jgi:AbrB family looped-hinge helix DNA binding protein